MIRLVIVPPAKVKPIWPRLDAAYEEACKHALGTLTKEAIYARAIAGECSLWITADDTTEVTATCITSIGVFPGGLRAMLVEITAGSMKFDIFEFREQLEKHAKSIGCNALFFIVPRGWVKELPDYRIARLVMCKEL